MGVLVRHEDRSEGGYLAHLTIDNAGKLNSLNRTLMTEIVETVGGLAGDPRLRLAVVSGAGLELACACDLRVASERSVFGMPEVKIGIPSVVEAALLPGLIGQGRTRRLLLTGETISAGEALAWGLVDAVVAAGELDEAIERFVGPILAAGPRAVRLQKSLILGWEELPTAAAIERGIDCFVSAFDTDEPVRMAGAMLAKLRTRRRSTESR